MPRPKKLKVVDYPRLVPGRSYPICVIEVKQKRKTLLAVFRHIGEEQQGREQSVSLSLPVRPSGLTASFFIACGVEVRVDATINPRNAIGKTVNVRFSTSLIDKLEVVSFETLDMEKNNEPTESESTDT